MFKMDGGSADNKEVVDKELLNELRSKICKLVVKHQNNAIDEATKGRLAYILQKCLFGPERERFAEYAGFAVEGVNDVVCLQDALNLLLDCENRE